MVFSQAEPLWALNEKARELGDQFPGFMVMEPVIRYLSQVSV